MTDRFNQLQRRLGRIVQLDYIDDDTLQFTTHMGQFVYYGKTNSVLECLPFRDAATETAQYYWYLINDYVRDDAGNYRPRESLQGA